MEYQKLKNLLKNNLLTTNQASKFRIKNWIEMSDDARIHYGVTSQVKFKITMLKSTLCDYIDAYMLVYEKIISRAGKDRCSSKKLR